MARKRFEDYAERCGYETLVITEPIRDLPKRKFTWQKLCMQDLPWFGDGRQVICIDSDILIARDAPPFPDVPDGMVAGVLDKEPQGLNSGVLSYRATPEIAELMDLCHADPDPFWDQRALWKLLQEQGRFMPLDKRYHCMFYMRSWSLFNSLFGHNWLYHSLGSKRKLKFIETLLKMQGR